MGTYDSWTFRCPGCRSHINKVRGDYNRGPEPGDISICLHCLQIMEFKEDMLIPKTLKDFNSIDQVWLIDAMRKMRE